MQTLRICRRALGLLFRSPLAYVILTLFLLCTGFYFHRIVIERTFSLDAMSGSGSAPAEVCRAFWRTSAYFLVFIVPILTMGALAGEKSRGTMELLLTSPLRFRDLIWGKYIALLLFLTMMMAPTLVGFGFLRVHSQLELGQMVAGYIAIASFGIATLAIGVFFSALTSNQIVAGFGTLVSILVFWFIDAAGSDLPSPWRGIFRHFSFYFHYKNILTGNIGLDNLVYMLSAAAFFLFLTHEAIRMLWKNGKWD